MTWKQQCVTDADSWPPGVAALTLTFHTLQYRSVVESYLQIVATGVCETQVNLWLVWGPLLLPFVKCVQIFQNAGKLHSQGASFWSTLLGAGPSARGGTNPVVKQHVPGVAG